MPEGQETASEMIPTTEVPSPRQRLDGIRQLHEKLDAAIAHSSATGDYTGVEAYTQLIQRRIEELRSELDPDQINLRDRIGKEHGYQFVGRFNSEGIARAEDPLGWTLIDRSGIAITDKRFLQLGEFIEGRASVGHALIDTKGNYVGTDYDDVGDISDGYSLIKIDQDHYGYLNLDGTLLPLPEDLEAYSPEAKEFHEGYASMKDARGYWRIIDKAGRILNEDGDEAEDQGRNFTDIGNCSEGYMPVNVGSNDWELYNVSTGEFMPKKASHYSYIKGFKDGLCIVSRQDKYYYIDSTGNQVFGDKRWEEVDHFSEDAAVVETYDNRTGRHMHFIDKNGENLFGNKEFYSASSFSEGLASVEDTDNRPTDSDYSHEYGAYYYINKQGKKVIAASFGYAGIFNGGVAEVVDTGDLTNNSYYINRRGERMFAPR